MINKKIRLIILNLILISTIFSILSVPNTSATGTYMIQQLQEDGSQVIREYPAFTAVNEPQAVYQTFQATETTYLQSIILHIARNKIAMTGTLVCELRGMTGSYGTTSTPDSTVYDTSAEFDFAGLNDADFYGQYVSVAFQFGGDYQLTDNDYYSFVVYATSASPDLDVTPNFLLVSWKGTSVYGGNLGRWQNNQWTATSTSDAYMQILTDTTANPTPAPTPTPTPAPGTHNVTFSVATNGVVNDLSGGSIAWNTSSHSGVEGEYYNTWVGYTENLQVEGVPNSGYSYNGQAWIEYNLIPYENPYTHSYDGRELRIIVDFRNETGPFPSPTTWERIEATATPSTGNWYWNGTAWVNTDNIVETTTDLVLPLLIPLIVILICAGLGAYFIGLWGFVLGLDVAVVLLYVVLPTYMPLWGVVLVGIGNVIVLMLGRRG